MRSIIILLLIAFICGVITWLIKEHLKAEKTKAEEQRRKLLHQMERKRTILAKQENFKRWKDWIYLRLLYPGYFLIFGLFVSIAFFIGFIIEPIKSKEDFATYCSFAELAWLLLSALLFQRAIELYTALNGFGPRLKVLVYGKRINIDELIKSTRKDIFMLDREITKLDAIIAE